jgi:hypothetical protein
MLLAIAKSRFWNRLLRFICWWLLAGGLSTFAVGAGFAVYTSVFLFRSIATKGTIVRLDQVADEEDGTINYAPVFTFASDDGQIHTIRTGVASDPPGFDEGEVVRVLYIKSNPAGAKIASFWQLWLVTVICCGLGLLFGVPGYLLLRRERRLKRQLLASDSVDPMLAR